MIEDFDHSALYYLAGPMSGHKQFNVPYFYEVAAKLRQKNVRVLNPADLDSDTVRSTCLRSLDGDIAKLTETWGDMLARDVKLVADEVAGIILLPGWEGSRGARLEAFVALLCGHRFLLWDDRTESLVKATQQEINDGIL
jgi:hypothetical protein